VVDFSLLNGVKVSSHAYSVGKYGYSYKFKEDDANSVTPHELRQQSDLALYPSLLLI
jgi:hypothetical protein